MPRATAGAPRPAALTQQVAFQRHRRFATGLDLDPAGRRLGAEQRGMEGECGAGGLGIAPERQHIGVAVDDPGGRRQQCGVAVQRRLHRAGGFARKQLHVAHAIGLGMGADRLQLFGLFRRGRDDQLAAIAIGDAVLLAITVKRMLAADAHPRHQAAGTVVDAGMDHLAVTRGGHGADPLGGFQHDHFAPCLCQAACDWPARSHPLR